MEEKKNGAPAQEPKTYTEEEVSNIVRRVQMDCQREISKTNNIFARLSFLFKVIENEKTFNGVVEGFVDKCVNEVVEILTLENEESDNKEGE